jgi:hypothetical protein
MARAARRSEPETQAELLDSRALELASASDALLKHHLVECRDRYLAVEGALKDINRLLFRGLTAVLTILVAVVFYLLTGGHLPAIH